MRLFHVYSRDIRLKEYISLQEIFKTYSLTEIEFNDLCVMDRGGYLSIGPYLTIERIK